MSILDSSFSSSKKRILFFVNVDWFFLSHRLPIALEALENGYEVHVATTITDSANILKFKDIKVHPITIQRSGANIYNLLVNLVKIFLIIRRVKPDILHAITIKPILLSGLVRIFYKRLPFISSISGLGITFNSPGFFSRVRLLIINIFYRLSFSGENLVVIFQNNNDMQRIDKLCNLSNSSKILIPGSGVDLNLYKPENIIVKPPLLLFASRLLISKGILEFVAAAKHIKSARFVVVGMLDEDSPDCVEKHRLQEWIDKGIIEYWGHKTNMNEIINKSSVVVLPSYYGEGLPKILIEAAACGKPVITTDHPGCRDAIISNKTGILIPKKDPNSLIRSIKYILSSEDKCYRMGIASRELAEKKFDIRNVIKSHLEIYKYYANINSI